MNCQIESIKGELLTCTRFLKIFTSNCKEMFLLLLRKNDICELKKKIYDTFCDFFQKKLFFFLKKKSNFTQN